MLFVAVILSSLRTTRILIAVKPWGSLSSHVATLNYFRRLILWDYYLSKFEPFGSLFSKNYFVVLKYSYMVKYEYTTWLIISSFYSTISINIYLYYTITINHVYRISLPHRRCPCLLNLKNERNYLHERVKFIKLLDGHCNGNDIHYCECRFQYVGQSGLVLQKGLWASQPSLFFHFVAIIIYFRYIHIFLPFS